MKQKVGGRQKIIDSVWVSAKQQQQCLPDELILPDASQSLWSEQGFHKVAFIGSFHRSLGSGLLSA